jgi:hypothetical protein
MKCAHHGLQNHTLNLPTSPPASLLQRLDLPYIFPNRDHTHSSDLWLLGLKSMDGGAEKCYIRKHRRIGAASWLQCESSFLGNINRRVRG